MLLQGTEVFLDVHVVLESFGLVAAAELFDKTWFVALVMALRFDRMLAFTGASLALLLHTLLAACFGYAIARLFSAASLDFAAGLLYTFFAVLYARDYMAASPDNDVLKSGRAEVEEELNHDSSYLEGALSPTEYGTVKATLPQKRAWTAFGQVFLAVFIAEWGDRTQIAMIGQHASNPVVPVVVGSAAAFLLLTLSAVGVASFADKLALSERTIHGIGAVSFIVFATLAFRDGLAEYRHRAEPSGPSVHMLVQRR
mmetsp:Transcript_29183/g.53295  ORF Transcript_29183/g.53295 Transcript_29183/m.53295 type:complete len:256 (+) Transcript_29183:113-880(+)